MDWVYLGHAMWLLRAGELRLLFDPLVAGPHHGGVFDLDPPRRLDVRALRPDFIVVTHRHPDHFDVASLRILAACDPDTVVITSDALVEATALRLGFHKVVRLDSWQRIELDGDLALLTTPSIAEDIEWGVMVASAAGVAFNQVDTVYRDVAAIRDMLARAAVGLSLKTLTQRLDLALVRWQPMLEVQALLGERTAFPFADYAETLSHIAALGAAFIVPASCGARHQGPSAWMNEYVLPVSQPRAVDDIGRRCPNSQALPAQLGACYRLRDGMVTLLPRDQEIEVTPLSTPVAGRYLPFAGPPLIDPNLDGLSEDALRTAIEPWIEGPLCRGLALAYPHFGTNRPIHFALEVVYPSGCRPFLFTVSADGCQLQRCAFDDYDMFNAIAASQLADVIAGRRHWGEPLLGGMLRAANRAYRVDPEGLHPLPIGAIFLYYALSYADSHKRLVEYQLSL